ncbi:MAG: ComEA family DNA-binding protein [Candidatus Hydrogenedentes bacterium]|nr:ComEA family DNA-binding protein [Candidatus Hydrogenedentota bacterium]
MLSNYLTRKEQLILLFVAAAAVIGGIVLYAQRNNAVPETANASIKADSPPRPSAPSASAPLEPDSPTEPPPAEVAPSPSPSEPVSLHVAVRGAVYAPGLYTFKSSEDPRVQDLLDAAGGLEDYADVSDINVAARLMDGTTLTVPGKPDQRDADGVIRISRETPVYTPNPPQYTVSGWRPEAAPRSTTRASNGATIDSTVSSEGLLDINSASQTELETLPGIGKVLASRIIEYRQQTPFRSVDELMNVKGIAEKRLADIRHLITVR